MWSCDNVYNNCLLFSVIASGGVQAAIPKVYTQLLWHFTVPQSNSVCS